jgi:hypothetical protein
VSLSRNADVGDMHQYSLCLPPGAEPNTAVLGSFVGTGAHAGIIVEVRRLDAHWAEAIDLSQRSIAAINCAFVDNKADSNKTCVHVATAGAAESVVSASALPLVVRLSLLGSDGEIRDGDGDTKLVWLSTDDDKPGVQLPQQFRRPGAPTVFRLRAVRRLDADDDADDDGAEVRDLGGAVLRWLAYGRVDFRNGQSFRVHKASDAEQQAACGDKARREAVRAHNEGMLRSYLSAEELVAVAGTLEKFEWKIIEVHAKRESAGWPAPRTYTVKHMVANGRVLKEHDNHKRLRQYCININGRNGAYMQSNLLARFNLFALFFHETAKVYFEYAASTPPAEPVLRPAQSNIDVFDRLFGSQPWSGEYRPAALRGNGKMQLQIVDGTVTGLLQFDAAAKKFAWPSRWRIQLTNLAVNETARWSGDSAEPPQTNKFHELRRTIARKEIAVPITLLTRYGVLATFRNEQRQFEVTLLSDDPRHAQLLQQAQQQAQQEAQQQAQQQQAQQQQQRAQKRMREQDDDEVTIDDDETIDIDDDETITIDDDETITIDDDDDDDEGSADTRQ